MCRATFGLWRGKSPASSRLQPAPSPRSVQAPESSVGLQSLRVDEKMRKRPSAEAGCKERCLLSAASPVSTWVVDRSWAARQLRSARYKAPSICCLPATGRDACPQGTCPDATSDSDVAPDHRPLGSAIEAIFSIEVGTPSRPHPPFSAVRQRWPESTDAKATTCFRLRQQQVAESKAIGSS